MKNGVSINDFCTTGDKNGNIAFSWGGLSFVLARSGVAQSASKKWPKSGQIMQRPVHGVTQHRGLGPSRVHTSARVQYVVRGNRPRAVINHTASMLNEDITPADAYVRLDTLASLGQELRHAARDPSSPLHGKDLVVWKTDNAHTYSNLPVHPAYQLR
jgi:hypothetical protein